MHRCWYTWGVRTRLKWHLRMHAYTYASVCWMYRVLRTSTCARLIITTLSGLVEQIDTTWLGAKSLRGGEGKWIQITIPSISPLFWEGVEDSTAFSQKHERRSVVTVVVTGAESHGGYTNVLLHIEEKHTIIVTGVIIASESIVFSRSTYTILLVHRVTRLWTPVYHWWLS